MCGICGELRFDGSTADMSAIERMSDKLARRGPNHAGVFSDGPLAFGHRRLAIIDLTADGDQPMVDEELKLMLVFNGTIYNYKELRTELIAMGYRFFSESDSEVILKAYHAWGADCLQLAGLAGSGRGGHQHRPGGAPSPLHPACRCARTAYHPKGC